MKILALGDVVGERAVPFLAHTLPQKRAEWGVDFVIANGENVCDIKGISPVLAERLLAAGVDVITSGNHVFDRRDSYSYLEEATRLLRPCNYPAECPGNGAQIITSGEGWRILVVNVSGCVFMEPLASPFTSVQHVLDSHRGHYDFAVLDVHAEATSEKLALAHYFDGKFAAIFGTHTHVQTADATVLPNGTGYITDLGMTGPTNGILGVQINAVLLRNRTHLPQRFTVADGPLAAHGALFDIDPFTGKAKSVTAVTF